jgi:hypothetical protein
MARPFIPDVDKKRTVPLRLTKPQYRSLGVIGAVTGDTIQELLRTGASQIISSKLKEISEAGVTLPSEYAIGVMSDSQFDELIANPGRVRPQTKKPGGFNRRPTENAAA